MYNLAAILRDQVDLKGVRSLLEEVLEISRRKYGADHSNTLATMHNIACTLLNQRDFNELGGLKNMSLKLEGTFSAKSNLALRCRS